MTQDQAPATVAPVGDGDDTAEAKPAASIRVDIYHHFPDGIPVAVTGSLDLDVAAIVQAAVTLTEPTPPRPPATRAILIVQDSQGATNMPGQITVDTTNEVATLAFEDDHGDLNAAPPSNESGPAVVSYTSDTPTAATIDPTSGAITPVAEGVTNIGVAPLLYPDGSQVFEADGVTPFPVPDPVPVTVGAGAAVGDALSLSV